MAVVKIGPALAGFPAFPELPLGALADPTSLPPATLQAIVVEFQALNFQFTATSFSFQLDSAIFGRPGAFNYSFYFTGSFRPLADLISSNPGNPLAIFGALVPATAAYFPVQFLSSTATNTQTGQLVIASTADTLGPPISFLDFFASLLDPANYTHDLLLKFTNDLAEFTTLDLSAFTHGVIDARPNGPTVSVDGTVSKPDGTFVGSHFGLVSFASELQPLAISKVIAGNGNDVLGAGDGNVTLYAGNGNDVLLGGKGIDILVAGKGMDILVAGIGANTLMAGSGVDILVAGPGTDVLVGGAGRATLIAGGGHDILTGGKGADLFVIQRTPGAVTTITNFDSRKGDRLALPNGGDMSGREGLRFGQDAHGALTVILGHGDRSQTVIFDGISRAADVLRGLVEGADVDYGRIHLANVSGGVVRADGKGDTLIGQGGHATLIDGKGDDTLIAGWGGDTLVASAGNDILLGGQGDDTLRAGQGDDVLDGGDGNDILIAGMGHAILTGGPGLNTFVFEHVSADYGRITDFKAGTDKIDLAGILGRTHVTADNFSSYVKVVPLGPTELTGFVEVSQTGNGTFQIVSQIDQAFSITNGQSGTVLTANDFILSGSSSFPVSFP